MDAPLNSENNCSTLDLQRELLPHKIMDAGLATLLTQFTALSSSLQAGLLFENASRQITFTNETFCTMFGISEPDYLVGLDGRHAAELIQSVCIDPAHFLSRTERIVTEQLPVTGKEIHLTNGRWLEQDYAPVMVDGICAGHVWNYRDITARKQMEESRQASQRLLEAQGRIHTLYIEDSTPAAVFGILLDELLALTQSEYGFIGEVLFQTDGQPYLRTNAITNIAWNEETMALMKRFSPNLEFHNLNTLFGQVMVTGQPVITNDPLNDPRRGGLPKGHPPMNAFLGLPFYRQNKLTGMVGIANRPGGYDEALIGYLQPFLATCASLIQAYGYIRERENTTQALRQSEDRYRALYDENPSMYFTLGADGTVLSVNQFGAQQLGYTAEELVGKSVFTMFHHDDQPQVQGRLAKLLAHPDRIVHWKFRKIRKDGSVLWVEETARAASQNGGTPIILVVCKDITEHRQAEEKLHRSHEVRERISHDLHDSILQSLYAIGLSLEATKQGLKPGSRALCAQLNGSIEQLNALVKEVRGFITRATMTDENVKNITQTLQALKGAFTVAGGSDVALRLDPSLATAFSAEHVSHIVNIIKEALSNSVRHARAAHRSVILGRFRGRIRLEIRDDGVGFRVSHQRGTGMGLSTMRARAKKLGGRLSIISQPGHGTRVALNFPLSLSSDAD